MKEKHVAELLPTYATGTLGPKETTLVRSHLETCAGCREELASWESVRDATRAASEASPTPAGPVLDLALAEIGAGTPEPALPLASRLSLAGQLLWGQMPLVRSQIWVASLLTMAVGLLVALTASGPAGAGLTLAFFAPVVAAVGVASLYGPENDPSLEISLSTPTSPRLVLLARLTLVYAYDLALALGATVVVAATLGGPGLLWPLVGLWIGPMLFLSALALFLSLVLGPTPAVFITMSLWGTRLLAEYDDEWRLMGTEFLNLFWQTNAILLPLAVVLIFLSLLQAPRRERLA